LQAECADSNFCFLFNKHTVKLKRYFYDFKFLTHLADVHEMMPNDASGEVRSTQGRFYHFHFERAGYKAEAVLKNASQESNDNLYYEYVVGLFLNHYLKIFPCFVETYHLFQLPLEKRESIQYRRTLTNFFRRNLKAAPNMGLDEACAEPLSTCLLLQYVPNSVSLSALAEQDLNLNIWGVLMQVFFTLSQLHGLFAHYDLHIDNLLLYETEPDTYITYHYHFGEEDVVQVDCQYLVKMIDYARCFCPSLPETRAAVRANLECRGRGFTWFSITPPEYSDQKDVMLLYSLNDHVYIPELRETLLADEIQTVHEALNFVERMLQSKSKDLDFSGKRKYGDMHIYATMQEFVFIKV